MQIRRKDVFTTIRTEGAILPSDLLQRIPEGGKDIPGLDEAAYHLSGERINEAINRAWNRLQSAWKSFQDARSELPESEPGTRVTRERWLLPLFQELGYGRLLAQKSVEIGGKPYPISHGWQHTPIHLPGFRVDLDRRMPGVAGAARMSPHSMIQEYLNRSDDHLWAFVSNGLRLRTLRDNVSLTRQAYVEFDLESMMEGEVYADFVVLWLICHQSRVEAENPAECWLEQWSKLAHDQGTRALDQLRDGVQTAIEAIGSGFLSHPANEVLRDKLKSGTLDKQEYYRQILRFIYRLIFLFVAEDRDLLLKPTSDQKARERYLRFYAMRRIRELAEKKIGSRHSDLFHGVRLVMEKLDSDQGCSELALPAMGSLLFARDVTPDLEGLELGNRRLMAAVRAVSYITSEGKRRPVDFKNLGSEELGSVYESLLELHPELNSDTGAFELKTAGGHERKTTGSYYTPSSLVQCLLDSALEPVIEDRLKEARELANKGRQDDSFPDWFFEAQTEVTPNSLPPYSLLAEKALLSLKVCDPACGSGHFLVAAAHRMAKRLAAVRTGDEEPSPEATRTALRDVIGRCIYGVDINPMAVELCKVGLWLEAMNPERPLSFLDHHIQCGNSLLGTTPALLEKGIPDAAFKPIEGDDKEYCQKYKKLHKEERTGQMRLFDAVGEPWEQLGNLAAGILNIDTIDDSSIEGVREKQALYENVVKSSGYQFGRMWADAWCTAFVWIKKKSDKLPYPITEEVFRRIERNPHSISKAIQAEIKRLSDQYNFFHWHLAFPDVFRLPQKDGAPKNEDMGWNGGFDVVLGNPPWKTLEFKEKEWFANSRPDISEAPSTALRRRMIGKLEKDNPILYYSYLGKLREAEGLRHLIKNADKYPFSSRGKINTYALFSELKRNLLSPVGRVGCIVPSGIATDDTTKYFFQNLIEKKSLVSLYDFENRQGIFPGVHRSYKFCLLTLTGSARPAKTGAEFVFFAHQILNLKDSERKFSLNAQEIELLNPNTRTCPIFRSKRDAEITKNVYKRVPVFIDERKGEGGNPWSISFKQGLFNMTSDSHLFRTRKELEAEGWKLEGNVFVKNGERYLPLYEGKMIHQYNHRHASIRFSGGVIGGKHDVEYPSEQDLANPSFLVMPRFWVRFEDVKTRCGDWSNRNRWFLCYRRITRAVDFTTSTFAIIPEAGTGDTSPVLFVEHPMGPPSALLLCANFNSFVVNYAARQKISGIHLDFYPLKQLPILSPHFYGSDWVSFFWPLILRNTLFLTFVSYDVMPFAKGCSYDGNSFPWDDQKRLNARCELEAAYFHFYGINRDDVGYIMETFPIVKRKEDQKYGEYRTKLTILKIYDEMKKAMETGKPYQTILDPPPADPRVAHPLRDNSY